MMVSLRCQRCAQLLPPPPIFSLGPPPNVLSLDIHCASRLISSAVQHKKGNSTSSSMSVPVALGILIALIISTSAILFVKNRMTKRRKYLDRPLSTGHNHQNRTGSPFLKPIGNETFFSLQKFLPLLSDSYSSDQTICTPLNEYPCHTMESFDMHHEYEQINSSNYYCLIYCRQCGSYHQTSRSSCHCHLRSFELQPMFADYNR